MSLRPAPSSWRELSKAVMLPLATAPLINNTHSVSDRENGGETVYMRMNVGIKKEREIEGKRGEKEEGGSREREGERV